MITIRPKTRFSRSHLSVFLIVFAILGIILLIKSLAAPNPNLPGDLNNDNTVNITDLSILLSNYGTTNATADINGDGIVNVLDLSILLSHYGQSITGTGTINATAMSHTVDGQLSESDWNLSNTAAKTTTGATNNTTTFGVMRDNTYLYLGAKVLDSALNNSAAACYNNDSVEFYIDPNNDGGTSYDSTDKQLTQAWNNSALCGLSASTPGVLHAWAAVTGGYTVEIAVPWSSLGVTPSAGQTLGIDVCNNDNDSGSLTAQTCWNANGNDSQNPSAFGHMSLSGTPAGTGSGGGTGGGGSTAPGSWLGTDSPWNTPIPSNPSVIYNYNTGPLAGLPGVGLNTYTWGIGIFDQLSNFSYSNFVQPSWACGTNPCWKMDSVPVPPQFATYESTQASLGDNERHASIHDGDKIFNVYEANQDSAGWHFVGGGELRYGGSGVWNNNLGPWVGRASGFADYDGAIRKSEVDAGVINHALASIWPKSRIAKTAVSPAVTSDGSCTSTCAPMGSRIQLDPTKTPQDFLNMGFTSYWLPILTAMQKYGLYISDSSSSMALMAEVWNNNGRVVWPSQTTGWNDVSSKLVPLLRIIQAPPAPVLDDRTIFGQPHK